ncbi:MAG TPA: hypothetical protein VHY08_21490 [Bacillota bacterium]|nr:hypothetical protein [Bacillota bacterium]
MKKWSILVVLVLFLVMAIIAGCGGSKGSPPNPNPTPTSRQMPTPAVPPPSPTASQSTPTPTTTATQPPASTPTPTLRPTSRPTPTATSTQPPTPTPTPPPMTTTLFSDGFYRPDGLVGNNWVDMGGNHNEQLTSSCDIFNNTLRIKATLTLLNGSAWWMDYCFSGNVEVTTSSTAIGFRFRIQDSNNCYSVDLNNGLLYIRKLVAGSWNASSLVGTKSASVSYTTNTFYPLKVVALGNNIKVYFDNGTLPVIDCNDNAPYLSGKVGLCAYTSSGSLGIFDDVVVTTYSPVLYNLHWDGAYATGGGSANPFEVSTHFDATDLAPYLNGRIVKVRIFLRNKPDGSLTLKIYKGGASQPGGTVVCNQSIDLSTLNAYSWNEIPLTSPVTILNNDYWVGFSVASTGAPIGTDAGPLNPKGGWMYSNSSWNQNPGFNANWNIQTVISVP